MSIRRSEGILLRRHDLRETSIILTFYTKDAGKIRGVIRGARGNRAQEGGAAFELFARDDVVFYERRRSDLCTISQCDLVEFFAPVRSSLERFAYASYFIELIDAVTEPAVSQPAVFELILNSLRLIGGEASPRRVARIFEIKLLDLLGMMPGLAACTRCGSSADGTAGRFSLRDGGVVCAACGAADPSSTPILAGTVNFIEHIRRAPFDKVAQVKVAERVGRDLERMLRSFLDYHLNRRLKTLDFLRALEA